MSKNVVIMQQKVRKAPSFLMIVFFQFFISVGFSQGDFVPGTLGLKDGTNLDCDFVMKVHNGAETIFDKNHKYIYYKKPGSDEVLKMDQKELTYLYATVGDKKFLLRKLPYYYLNMSGKYKKEESESWMHVRGGCEELQSYLLIQGFELYKDGTLWESYLDGMGSYLLFKPDQDAPHVVCNVFLRKQPFQKGFDKQTAKMLKIYFKNDQNGLKFLEGKKRVSIEELVSYVDQTCGQ